MKKLIMALFMVGITTMGFSQTLTKLVDEMAGKIYWVDEGVLYLEEENNAGFRLNGRWKYNSNEPLFEGFTAKVVGVGTCVEKVQLIVLFEDGQKITKTSWNDFNCEGDAWYFFDKKELSLLTTVPIDKVRFTNGRTYESITGEIDTPNYFITLYNKSLSGDYETITE
jgi:hypothetical protein